MATPVASTWPMSSDDGDGAAPATSYAVHMMPPAQNNADQRLRKRRENIAGAYRGDRMPRLSRRG